MTEQEEIAFWETIDDRKKTIEEKLRCKVFPIVLKSIGEEGALVVGFAKEPDLVAKARLIDKSADNGNGLSIEACIIALDSLIIKGETDERIWDKKDERYFMGAAITLQQFMFLALPVFKKK